MVCPPRLAIASLLLLTAAAPEGFAAHIRGKVVRVGFPGSGRDTSVQGTDLYRPGYWTPILVELNNDDGDLFEGALQARQVDRDGDQIISTLPVALRGMKEIFIYVPAGPPQLSQPFILRMVGPDGEPVAMFDDDNKPTTEWRPAADPHPVPPSAQVLLDISARPLNQLSGLATDVQLVRELLVTRGSPAYLPDSVPGLQMVDIVVWDDADPTQVRDISQLQALLDWVHRGGTLVLGVARNWELVSKSPLAPLLPAALKAPVSGRNDQPPGKDHRPMGPLALALLSSRNYEFQEPITYCPIRLSDLTPDAIPLIPSVDELDEAREDEPSEQARARSQASLVFAASRPCGRGRIVLVSAEIRTLLSEAPNPTREPFLRRILGLRRMGDFSQQATASFGQRDVYAPIEASTGFHVTSEWYFIAAFFFVVIYIVVATWGSWAVLQRRQRVYLAWTVFAVVAAAASASSLLAVQVIRGIGNRVQQLCVVDGFAGSDRAVASCYLGLKTASHVSLDLALPRDFLRARETADNPGGLMPLPVSPDDYTLSQYSAGARYQAGGPVGQLWNVPVRATLKQFQGTWQGHLPGTLQASLARRSSGTYQLALDSWLLNNLDTDLTDCYLMITGLDVADLQDNRPSRGHRIMVYHIPTLPRGKRLVWRDYLIERQRREQEKKPVNQRSPIDEANPDWSGSAIQLSSLQSGWLNAAGLRPRDLITTREEEVKLDGKGLLAALMVLSTFDELNLFDQGGTNWLQSSIQRSRGLELDRCDALTTRTALLVGFAPGHPGPVRLSYRRAGGTSADWEALDPSEANTLYRFVIPLGSR